MKEQWLELINLAQQSSGLLSVSLSPALWWMSQDSPFLLLGWEREITILVCWGLKHCHDVGLLMLKPGRPWPSRTSWPLLSSSSLCMCVVSNTGQQCGERKRRVSPYSGSNSTSRLMRTGVISGLVCMWGWNLGGKYTAPLPALLSVYRDYGWFLCFLCFSVFSKLAVITISSMGIKTKN